MIHPLFFFLVLTLEKKTSCCDITGKLACGIHSCKVETFWKLSLKSKLCVYTGEGRPSILPASGITAGLTFWALIKILSSKYSGCYFDVANNSENETVGFVLIGGSSLLNHAIAGLCLLIIFGHVASHEKQSGQQHLHPPCTNYCYRPLYQILPLSSWYWN